MYKMDNRYLEFMAKLEPQYDGAKSFYHKAKVYRDDKGSIYLQSYDTIVAQIKDPAITGTKKSQVIINGWYSRTTARHINEFLLQYTNCDRKLSKKDIEGGETIWL